MDSDEVTARVEIAALIARYNTSGDSGRRTEFSSVFTKDAILEAPGIYLEGVENIVEGLFSRKVEAKFVRHHLATSTVVFEQNNLAKGRTYFQVITEVGLDHAGVYVDCFSRESNDWKIASRKVLIDFIGEESRFFKAEPST